MGLNYEIRRSCWSRPCRVPGLDVTVEGWRHEQPSHRGRPSRLPPVRLAETRRLFESLLARPPLEEPNWWCSPRRSSADIRKAQPSARSPRRAAEGQTSYKTPRWALHHPRVPPVTENHDGDL